MTRKHTPACCADNVTSGFVTVLETRSEGDEVVGTKFQITIVDSVGIAHERETKHCPACNLDLPSGRNGCGVPCVSVDAWYSPLVEGE
jgi:hypothetical protein